VRWAQGQLAPKSGDLSLFTEPDLLACHDKRDDPQQLGRVVRLRRRVRPDQYDAWVGEGAEHAPRSAGHSPNATAPAPPLPREPGAATR